MVLRLLLGDFVAVAVGPSTGGGGRSLSFVIGQWRRLALGLDIASVNVIVFVVAVFACTAGIISTTIVVVVQRRG